MSTTHTLPRKNFGVSLSKPAKPSKHDKRPPTASAGICLTILPLYEAKRCNGSWAAVTVHGGLVQMRGPRWAVSAWCLENNPQEVV